MKKISILMMMLCALAACSQRGQGSLDLTDLDPTTSPKDDFYQYATGGWQAKNPLKPEFSRFGSFDAIAETTQKNLNELFESMATLQAEPGTVDQKIADLYKMALDSTTRNALGAEPIQPYIAEIQAVKTKDELADLLGKMNLYGEGGFFGAGVSADLTDSDMQILYLGQGGLGMGDRDYYLLETNAELKAGYQAFLVKALTLAGVENAEEIAAKDMQVEDAMAKVAWTREQNRDMTAIYNPMSSAEIDARWPEVRFGRVCAAANIPAQDKVIVQQPSYFDGLDKIFRNTDLETLKAYVLAQFVSGQCGSLSDDFYTASWEFFSHQMSGAQEQQPRWKRAMGVPNSLLGEAVGQMYVERYFPESSKKQMVELVENLRTALGQHIDALEWMSDETKAKAREKLAAFTVKIGYPDKWKDYSTLTIDPENTYYENLRNASAWYVQDNLSKLGNPTDKTEWGMTPQTVNAYYNPGTNEICFPAGILQKPFFDPEADDAVNYGGIGVVIGHEMTHGFDDQGRKYDEKGNLNNWWTEEDATKFAERTQQLVKLFDEFQVRGNQINGQLTLGENIADLGGLNVAWDAYQMTEEAKANQSLDGFTPAQRFFISYGTIWRNNIRDKALERRIKEDVHSPAEARVNRTLGSMPHFYEAFEITPENKMFIAPEERAAIW